LGVLVSDGRIEVQSVHQRGGRGRPEKVYSLPAAEMGDNLAVLADSLLNETVNLETVAKRIAKRKSEADPSSLPMPKRLAAVIEVMNSMNYHARWEAGVEGPRILFGHCPYRGVSEAYPELCRMDTTLLSTLLGHPVSQTVKAEKGAQNICPFIFLVGQ
jgi:predicted ArsR family transcriptional regulator